MKLYIIEDDIHIVKILQKIIEDKKLGEVVGYSLDGNKGLEEIGELNPQLVLVDLLMPGKDGLHLVKEAKELYPKMKFIMISQVSCKDMIGKAYENGVEFYIYKPINAIEIENVVKKVVDIYEKENKLMDIENIFSRNKREKVEEVVDYETKIVQVLKRMGIIGQVGTKDIIQLVKYLLVRNKTMSDYTIKELCGYLTDNPKSMEQRIRRTAYTGMTNIANLGIDDYLNDVFVEFSNSVYDFKQVKRQMDYIKGKSIIMGSVNVKKFIDGIVFAAMDNGRI
ncbi:DNA-binding domain-containing protein [Anaeromicrobium sediminis]|uniref:Stage 0 sporulation protein A homolog n=1 Tax=Anaeromicrobium sediminis TaxID=1478221 RepID=A0A267MHV4_9FIRM|nr:DNA-binding domain-containing protein [Anaeromicrobium sediminis]PAB59116.1 hypothetical protein CCE28_11400 [Anaeromicrobium sediminis]